MDKANEELSKSFSYKMPYVGTAKNYIHDIRWKLFNVMFKLIYGNTIYNTALPKDFNPVMPGLEVKYAIEEAKKLDSKVVFLGYEVDDNTVHRLYHENRNTVLKTAWRWLTKNAKYNTEFSNHRRQVQQHGIRRYLESNCDQYTINW
jgi:hypothetical protein